MADADALPQLLAYRERRWLDHCSDVLNELLLPMAQQWRRAPLAQPKRGAVLIENRINHQWLFTVLNTALMCPSDTQLCLITDGAALSSAQDCLMGVELPLEPWWGLAEDLVPGTKLDEPASFNRMMKQAQFWASLPHKELLVCQTDSLLVKPLPLFFFDYPYLGAPFLPKQHSETFERRNQAGELRGFFKVDTPIHGRPDPDVYPHLHGNGGLSIRHRSVMQAICQQQGHLSPAEEMEDVFFSRHLNSVQQAAPLEAAQAFACESRYQPSAIGSHGAWTYWTSAELAEHLDQHWRQTWSLNEALSEEQASNR
jgi:hypothetical protein